MTVFSTLKHDYKMLRDGFPGRRFRASIYPPAGINFYEQRVVLNRFGQLRAGRLVFAVVKSTKVFSAFARFLIGTVMRKISYAKEVLMNGFTFDRLRTSYSTTLLESSR